MDLPKETTTVTKFSKTLALILFVSLPILALVLGYSVGVNNYSETKVDAIPTEVTDNQPIVTEKPKEEISNQLPDNGVINFDNIVFTDKNTMSFGNMIDQPISFNMPVKPNWWLSNTANKVQYYLNKNYGGVEVEVIKKDGNVSLDDYVAKMLVQQSMSEVNRTKMKIDHDIYSTNTFGGSSYAPYSFVRTEQVDATLINFDVDGVPAKQIISLGDYIIEISPVIGCETECTNPTNAEVQEINNLVNQIKSSIVLSDYPNSE